jgi:hypothetical protein
MRAEREGGYHAQSYSGAESSMTAAGASYALPADPPPAARPHAGHYAASYGAYPPYGDAAWDAANASGGQSGSANNSFLNASSRSLPTRYLDFTGASMSSMGGPGGAAAYPAASAAAATAAAAMQGPDTASKSHHRVSFALPASASSTLSSAATATDSAWPLAHPHSFHPSSAPAAAGYGSAYGSGLPFAASLDATHEAREALREQLAALGFLTDRTGGGGAAGGGVSSYARYQQQQTQLQTQGQGRGLGMSFDSSLLSADDRSSLRDGGPTPVAEALGDALGNTTGNTMADAIADTADTLNASALDGPSASASASASASEQEWAPAESDHAAHRRDERNMLSASGLGALPQQPTRFRSVAPNAAPRDRSAEAKAAAASASEGSRLRRAADDVWGHIDAASRQVRSLPAVAAAVAGSTAGALVANALSSAASPAATPNHHGHNASSINNSSSYSSSVGPFHSSGVGSSGVAPVASGVSAHVRRRTAVEAEEVSKALQQALRGIQGMRAAAAALETERAREKEGLEAALQEARDAATAELNVHWQDKVLDLEEQWQNSTSALRSRLHELEARAASLAAEKDRMRLDMDTQAGALVQSRFLLHSQVASDAGGQSRQQQREQQLVEERATLLAKHEAALNEANARAAAAEAKAKEATAAADAATAAAAEQARSHELSALAASTASASAFVAPGDISRIRDEATSLRREMVELRSELQRERQAAAGLRSAAEASKAEAAAARTEQSHAERAQQSAETRLEEKSRAVRFLSTRIEVLEAQLREVCNDLARGERGSAYAAAASVHSSASGPDDAFANASRANTEFAMRNYTALQADAQRCWMILNEVFGGDVHMQNPSQGGAAATAGGSPGAVSEALSVVVARLARRCEAAESRAEAIATESASLRAQLLDDVQRLQAGLAAPLVIPAEDANVATSAGAAVGSQIAVTTLQKHLLDSEKIVSDLRRALAEASGRADALQRHAEDMAANGHSSGNADLDVQAATAVLAAGDAATAAHVASIVARARADERSQVLREIQSAHRAAAGAKDAAAAEAVATAEGAAASAERECLRLRALIENLQQQWTADREQWRKQVDAASKQLSGAVTTALRYQQGVLNLLNALKPVQPQSPRQSPTKQPSLGDSITSAAVLGLMEAAGSTAASSFLEELSGRTRALLESEASLRTLTESLQARLEAQVADHAKAQETAAATARQQREEELTVAFRAEAEEAIESAVAVARQAAKDDYETRLFENEERLARDHEASMTDARSQWDEETTRRLDDQASAHARALQSAMESVREEEQRTAAAHLAVLSAQHQRALDAAEERVEQFREMALKEVARRRRIHSKLLDAQGNIRVHVRIRPSREELATLAANTSKSISDFDFDDGRGRMVSRRNSSSSGTSPSRMGPLVTVANGAAKGVRDSRRQLHPAAASPPPTGGFGSARETSEYVDQLQEQTGAVAASVAGMNPGNASPSVAKKRSNAAVQPAGDGCLIVRAAHGASAGYGSVAGADVRKTTFEYEFDEVHGPRTPQEHVFEFVRPMIDHALDGFNMVVFAYGQTGSGKTYTMEGPRSLPGVTIRTIRHLFAGSKDRLESRASAALLAGAKESDLKYRFCVSVFEVFNERVRDLLAGTVEADLAPADRKSKATASYMREIEKIGVGGPDAALQRSIRGGGSSTGPSIDSENLPLRDSPSGVEIAGLTRLRVVTAEEALEAIRLGAMNRAGGSHLLNEYSSRSHMIVRLWIDGPAPLNPGMMAATTPGSSPRVVSVVNLVDLAGSERVFRTGAEGDRLREATAINGSLSVLGSVISALRKKNGHVPYRDSKLTHALKDSLTGSAKVMMICCTSSDDDDVQETLCTLNFAQRCRSTALGAATKNVVSASGSRPLMPTTPHAHGGDEVGFRQRVDTDRERDSPSYLQGYGNESSAGQANYSFGLEEDDYSDTNPRPPAAVVTPGRSQSRIPVPSSSRVLAEQGLTRLRATSVGRSASAAKTPTQQRASSMGRSSRF